MIAQVVVEFPDAIIDGENIRKPLGDGAAGSGVGPVLWQEAQAERVNRDSRSIQGCLGIRNAHGRIPTLDAVVGIISENQSPTL